LQATTLPASEMDAMSGQEKQLTAVCYERHKRIEAQYSVHYEQVTSCRERALPAKQHDERRLSALSAVIVIIKEVTVMMIDDFSVGGG
jgi:hypothetical protein